MNKCDELDELDELIEGGLVDFNEVARVMETQAVGVLDAIAQVYAKKLES